MAEDLIYKIKQGDKTAFSILYRKYLSKVFNFAKLYIIDSNEVEEIVQDVFIKIWESRESIDADKNFDGFLFIITRNVIFNYSRKSFNHDFYNETVLEAVEESYDIEGELNAADLKTYIEGLVDMLPPRQQEVFKLSRNEHLSYKEISLKLGITEKTVERHINEALRFLRKNMILFTFFLG